MTRWRLAIEYDGGPFMGWQRQDHGPSVQQTIEEALNSMTGELAAVHAAGRTDAGVHALAMSAHVEIEKTLTEHRLREGLNALVRPQPISVGHVGEAIRNRASGCSRWNLTVNSSIRSTSRNVLPMSTQPKPRYRPPETSWYG